MEDARLAIVAISCVSYQEKNLECPLYFLLAMKCIVCLHVFLLLTGLNKNNTQDRLNVVQNNSK